MIFQKVQFSLYSFLLRFKLLPILLLLCLVTWTYFSISFYTRFNAFSSSPTSPSYFQSCLTTFTTTYPTADPNELLPLNTILRLIPVYSSHQQSCHITNQLNSSYDLTQRLHLFRDLSLEYLPNDVKTKHKINRVTILMNMGKIMDKVVYQHFGVYEILVFNIAEWLKEKDVKSVYVRDFIGGHETIDVKNLGSGGSVVRGVLHKVFVLVVSVVRVFFCSMFAGVIMVSTVVLVLRGVILVGEVVYRVTGNDAILRAIPFMNEYLDTLRNVRKKYIIKYVVLAYFVVSFVVLYGLIYFINALLKQSLVGVYYTYGNDVVFFQITVLQFTSMILLRSRTSIKHAPKIVLTLLAITHFLAQINHYKLPLFFTSLGFQVSLIFLLLVLVTVENSVAGSRDEDRPCGSHPRGVYFPNYNIAWHSIIPPLWTYFVPPHGRKFFSRSQLSYVDGEYDKLYCLLMGLPYEGEEDRGLRGELGENEGQGRRQRERANEEIEMANDLL